MAQPSSRLARNAPLLPVSDARDRGLVFVVATLCFLACLTALAVLVANRATQVWTTQLQSQATIVVRPRANETPDSAAARAAESLASVQGVVEARALEKSQAEALVAPWLGDIGDLDDLPIPRLVTVELDPRSPATSNDLNRALKAQGLDALVDDHSIWTKDIARAANLARGFGVGILALIISAAGAVIAFATRAGLRSRRDVVEVLHLVGAQDIYIARLFQERFAQMAGWAGSLGAIGAALIGVALRLMLDHSDLALALPIAWGDLLALLPCPLIAALVAAVVARLTAETLIAEIT